LTIKIAATRKISQTCFLFKRGQFKFDKNGVTLKG
jgi:hypothetical protein